MALAIPFASIIHWPRGAGIFGDPRDGAPGESVNAFDSRAASISPVSLTSALIRAAETGHEQVVLRNNKPVAAVVSIERLDELQRLRDDLLDVSLITARMLTTGPVRHSLDEAFALRSPHPYSPTILPRKRSISSVVTPACRR